MQSSVIKYSLKIPPYVRVASPYYVFKHLCSKIAVLKNWVKTVKIFSFSHVTIFEYADCCIELQAHAICPMTHFFGPIHCVSKKRQWSYSVLHHCRFFKTRCISTIVSRVEWMLGTLAFTMHARQWCNLYVVRRVRKMQWSWNRLVAAASGVPEMNSHLPTSCCARRHHNKTVCGRSLP